MKDEFQLTPAVLVALFAGDMANAMVAATPGGIEMQEKRGQEALVNSAMLPIEAPWEKLEALGFIRGEQVDDLFVKATMPTGWSKVATEHSMWSDLLDEQGRKRGAIFYKAAFYDRSAHLVLKRRFSCGCMPENGWGSPDNYRIGAVTDQDTIIWRTENRVERDDWDGKDALDKEAEEWIIENYPNYRDELAYWNS